MLQSERVLLHSVWILEAERYTILETERYTSLVCVASGRASIQIPPHASLHKSTKVDFPDFRTANPFAFAFLLDDDCDNASSVEGR